MLIGSTAAFGLLLTPSASLSKVTIVSSTGGAASTYPKGKELVEDAVLLLGRGERVTVRINDKQRSFSGPGKFRVDRAIPARTSASLFDSIMNFFTGDAAVASGAARGRSSSTAPARRAQRVTRGGAAAPPVANSPAAPPPPPPDVAYDMAAPPPPPPVSDGGQSYGSGQSYGTTTYAYKIVTPEPRGRKHDEIDIGTSENICVQPGGSIGLWRNDFQSAQSILATRLADNEVFQIPMTAGQQNVDIPGPIQPGEYTLLNQDTMDASAITIVEIEPETSDLRKLALSYARANCTGQLQALEATLAERGVEQASQDIFGTDAE